MFIILLNMLRSIFRSFLSAIYSKIYTQSAYTATKANALVLHCIDYRFIDNIHTQLNILKLHNNYDKIILAGSSLHINCKHNGCDYNHLFTEYFEKHLQLAYKLHDIKNVIIFEHESCMAYRNMYGDEYIKDPYTCHIKRIREFETYVKNNMILANFNYIYYFIKLDGSMEEMQI
jgi:hypothetical protein